MMKKSAVALAALTALCAAQAGELTAGKDTKFEINVDVGAYYVNIKDKDGVTGKEFLGKGLNQIETKATHNINADISVFGEIEVDYDPIADNSTVLTDDVKFGIKGKEFGTLTLGQFDSYFEDNVGEVLGVGHGENGVLDEVAGKANDGRHVQYMKKIGDLTFAADLTFSSNGSLNVSGAATPTKSSNGTALTVSYALGDLTVAAGTTQVAKYSSDKFEESKVKSAYGLSATYKLGNAKLLGLVAQSKGTDSKKTMYTGAGVVYTMGDFDFGFAMQQVALDGAAKRNQWLAGVGYNVYKGMQVYVDLNGLKDKNGKGDTVELGMKYSF
ncbi:MAG: Gram-negative porin [Pseudomonadota bacterium]|jgi:hypothetical protein